MIVRAGHVLQRENWLDIQLLPYCTCEEENNILIGVPQIYIYRYQLLFKAILHCGSIKSFHLANAERERSLCKSRSLGLGQVLRWKERGSWDGTFFVGVSCGALMHPWDWASTWHDGGPNLDSFARTLPGRYSAVDKQTIAFIRTSENCRADTWLPINLRSGM